MAIESDPEIIDSDGVPGLDIVFRRKSKSTKLPNVKPPKEGYWYDPVTQYLDLPTGKLCVVLESEFFEDGFEPEAPPFEITTQDDEDLADRDYESASCYIINCKPGFYHATAFSYFSDWDYPDAESRADLVVYLTPITKPNSFKMSAAVLPVYPKGQDLDKLKRATLGLKPRKPLKPAMKGKAFVADVGRSISGDWMKFPAKFQKKLQIEPGVMLSLEADGKQLDGIVIGSSTPHPSVWELIEKEKRKSKNFATFKFKDNMMFIEILKQARKGGFDLQEGISTAGKLTVVKGAEGETKKVPTKRSAKASPNTIELPKKRGKPGQNVQNLIPHIEKCFSWTQCCFVERDGKSLIFAINVSPPIEGKNVHGTPYKMGCSIEVHTSKLRKDGSPIDNDVKTFRGWPNGISRAFEWVSKQTAGGIVWTKRFELHRNFWDRKKSGKQKEAEKLAVAAWHEVFGIADHE